MAWNTPGNKGDNSSNNRNGDNRAPRNNNWGGGLPGPLKDLFNFNGNEIWRWALLAIALVILFTSFQLIGEQQKGVVLRFGQFTRVMDPGPNFKWPWPIEVVEKVNATEIKTFNNTVSVLTRDENIVNVEMNVQYRVSDPQLYLFGARQADNVLNQTSLSALREQVGGSDLDTVLGARGPLAVSAKERLQVSLDEYRTGLTVTELNLPNARPPIEVQPAFDEVNSAQQVRESLVNQAEAHKAKVVPEARGKAAQIRTQAEGYKEAKIAQAVGDATRFTLLQEQYRDAPEVTRKRLWLETMQQVLAENRKVVGGDGKQLIYIPMDNTAAIGATTASATTPIPPVIVPVDTTSTTRNAQRGTRPTSR